jgi:hypothetical protein
MSHTEPSFEKAASPAGPIKEKPMLYAILAYHVEAEVMSWTSEQDAAVMTGLLSVHDRLNANKLLGPAARLGGTAEARTLRGAGAGIVIDGPFAETKELVAGFWLWQVRSMDEAVEWLKRAPFDGGTEIEIRRVFEAEDFGENMTPEIKQRDERLRDQLAKKK